MYRQVIRLNPHSQTAASPSELHKLVMSGFRHILNGGHPDARSRVGVLFAVVRPAPRNLHKRPLRASAATQLLVQSPHVADWTGSEFADDPGVEFHAEEPFLVDLEVGRGQEIMVRGEYNPTRSVARAHRRGQRVPITDPHEVGQWYRRQWEDRGLLVDVEGMQVAPTVWAPGKGAMIAGTKITAHAMVTDPVLFSSTVEQGIGRSRAYGYGLTLHRT